MKYTQGLNIKCRTIDQVNKAAYALEQALGLPISERLTKLINSGGVYGFIYVGVESFNRNSGKEITCGHDLMDYEFYVPFEVFFDKEDERPMKNVAFKVYTTSQAYLAAEFLRETWGFNIPNDFTAWATENIRRNGFVYVGRESCEDGTYENKIVAGSVLYHFENAIDLTKAFDAEPASAKEVVRCPKVGQARDSRGRFAKAN